MSEYLTQPLRSEAEVGGERDYLAVAVAWRKTIWRQFSSDDERLRQLTDVCVRLRDGDEVAGAALATKAIWSPG